MAGSTKLGGRTADDGTPPTDPAASSTLAFDAGILNSMVGDDPDVLVEIVTHFEQVGESLRDELLHAARETDAAAASLLAHRLKSSARWVGALPLGTLCATLEEKSALAGPAELARQIAGVVKAMDETLMAMRLWREAQPALTPSPRGDDF